MSASCPPPGVALAFFWFLAACSGEFDFAIDHTRSSLEATAAKGIAEGRAEARSARRAGLQSEALAALDEIEAADPQAEFLADERGGLTLLTSGTDLRPLPCQGSLESEVDYLNAARCTIQERAAAFGRDPAIALQLEPTKLSGGADEGETIVELEEILNGFPVDRASVGAVFSHDVLHTLTAHLPDTAQFKPPQSLLSQEELESIAAAQYADATSLSLERRAYSTRYGALVAFIRVEIGDRSFLAIFDAESGDLLDEDAQVSHADKIVNRNATVIDYDNVSNYFGKQTLTESVSVPTWCIDLVGTCDVSGGSCLYEPRNQNFLPFYPDRVVATYTNAIWQLNNQLVSVAGTCTAQPWTPLINPSLSWFAVSVKSILDKIADFAQHDDAEYDVFGRASKAVDLVVHQHHAHSSPCTTHSQCLTPAETCVPSPQTCPVPPCTCGGAVQCFCTSQQPSNTTQADPFATPARINIHQDLEANIADRQADHARSLGTIVHEYGHYIHWGYGWSNFSGVREGFADLNPLRFAIWKKRRGEWPNVGYFTELFPATNYKAHSVDRNGEYRLENHSTPVNAPIDTYVYWNIDANCTQTEPANPYNCGRVLSHVFWELAWNICRLRYMGCLTTGTYVITPGAGAADPYTLAAQAFSYAADLTSTNVDTFLALVAARYQYWKNIGTISQVDLDRVNSVLAAHCVGPLNVCEVSYRNPESPLPSAYTEKHVDRYREAEALPLRYSAVTEVNTSAASAGKYLYLAMNQASGIGGYFYISEPGNYALRFITKPYDSLANKIYVWWNDPGGAPGPVWPGFLVTTPVTQSWTWAQGPTMYFNTFGTKQIWLTLDYLGNQDAWVDAVYIKKL